jgi:type II secretory pathway predicted ATPase ExeA
VSIDRLRSHYGFSRMPFGKDLAPGMLHAHDAHTRRSPGSSGASASRRSA